MENFDDTQFLTFDIIGNPLEILNEIIERFNNMDFKVLMRDEIDKVKIDYYREYLCNNVLELKDELFIGDIAYWADKNFPTQRVVEFERSIVWLYNHKGIINLKVLLTYFAEPGKTSTTKIQANSENIREALYAMSSKNYDIWTDNLVIEMTP